MSAFKKVHRPTIKDIASRANVSGWTVSQALNPRSTASIGTATRQRIMEIADELSYRPNLAARALVNGSTKLIAIWMRTHIEYSSYYGRIEHELHRVAREHGYNCITEDIPLDDVDNLNYHRPTSWPMDGVIACDVAGAAEAYVGSAGGNRTPIVGLGAWCAPEVDAVELDLRPGAIEAVHHLVAIGCKRVAFMSRMPIDVRGMAYAETIGGYGRPVEVIETAVDTRASALNTLQAYAEQHGLPDGLLCENDDMAIGSFRAACILGAKVPTDIAIVGCDGIEDTEFQVVPISTVKVPIHEMCSLAWTFVHNRITEFDLPVQRHVVTPSLVIRDSSRR